jgi:transcriptional regulator with XRE-family HTH domain
MKILLDEYMNKNNLTERQVSRLTGLSRSTIHEIRTGATMPRIDTLEILARGLQLKIGDLVESP